MNSLELLIDSELQRLHSLLKSASNTDVAWTLQMIKTYNETLHTLLAQRVAPKITIVGGPQ